MRKEWNEIGREECRENRKNSEKKERRKGIEDRRKEGLKNGGRRGERRKKERKYSPDLENVFFLDFNLPFFLKIKLYQKMLHRSKVR